MRTLPPNGRRDILIVIAAGLTTGCQVVWSKCQIKLYSATTLLKQGNCRGSTWLLQALI